MAATDTVVRPAAPATAGVETIDNRRTPVDLHAAVEAHLAMGLLWAAPVVALVVALLRAPS